MKNQIAILSLCIGILINANAQTVSDVDGNVYKTVKIGSQMWMAENLKTIHYRDGSPIVEIETKGQWVNTTKGAWCYYERNSEKNPTHGKLYNWYTVTDSHHVCPTGWHVPSKNEFGLLISYLGGQQGAGGKMKTTTLWHGPDTGTDNSSGFAALPSGYRFDDGSFTDLSYGADFWSSTTDSGVAWDLVLGWGYPFAGLSGNGWKAGLSVRCVAD